MPDPERSRADRLAHDLLSIGAVTIAPDDPFTWASGLRSPIYCDNRVTLGYPDVRRRICTGFAEQLSEAGWAPDVVVGTATAGIPHAAWLAEALDAPMAYVRSSAKAHGRGNQIEGAELEGRQVVVIEDLVSTGGSSLQAVRAVQEAGADVLGVAAIFTYGFDAADAAFSAAGVPLVTLTDYATLIAEVRRTRGLSEVAWASLQAWREDPQAWSARVLAAR